MRYSLTDLRLFVAIADSGSISKGAAACFLSPSSASLRIKALEETLRVQLLERLPRGVTLTRAGQVLLGRSRRCLSELEQMHADLAPYSAGVIGHVVLFATSTAMTSFIPEDLTKFLRERPSVRVTLEGRMSDDIIASVADGRADIGVVTWDGDHPALRFEAYRHDKLVLVSSEADKIFTDAPVRFADSLEHPYVSLNTGSAIHTFLLNKAAVLGQHVNIRIQVASFADELAMVRAGIGIALIPHSVALNADLTGIKVTDLDESWAPREMRICWRAAPDAMSEHAQALLSHLRGRQLSCAADD